MRKNYYYMFSLSVQEGGSVDDVNVLINKVLSASFKRAPIFHGIYVDKEGFIRADWYIDNQSYKPNMKTSKLLLELATLMMHIERTEMFATLQTNTRQV